MNVRFWSCCALLSVSVPAFAGPTLVTSVQPPYGSSVYDTGRVSVVVANTGNKTASNVSVAIQLPETNTSPTVHVMGDIDGYQAGCSRSGTVLTCPLGDIRRARSASAWIDLSFPESLEALTFTATASTSSSANLTNATDSADVEVANYDVAFGGTFDVTNDHCTGTDLLSYFECELYPSSISSHDATMNGDGTIDFGVGVDPLYTGTWSSDAPDHLVFSYSYDGTVVAEFEGWGVPGDCWEGATYFPGSAYMSMYRVCVQ